jgi:hypothetical protein
MKFFIFYFKSKIILFIFPFLFLYEYKKYIQTRCGTMILIEME